MSDNLFDDIKTEDLICQDNISSVESVDKILTDKNSFELMFTNDGLVSNLYNKVSYVIESIASQHYGFDVVDRITPGYTIVNSQMIQCQRLYFCIKLPDIIKKMSFIYFLMKLFGCLRELKIKAFYIIRPNLNLLIRCEKQDVFITDFNTFLKTYFGFDQSFKGLLENYFINHLEIVGVFVSYGNQYNCKLTDEQITESNIVIDRDKLINWFDSIALLSFEEKMASFRKYTPETNWESPAYYDEILPEYGKHIVVKSSMMKKYFYNDLYGIDKQWKYVIMLPVLISWNIDDSRYFVVFHDWQDGQAFWKFIDSITVKKVIR